MTKEIFMLINWTNFFYLNMPSVVLEIIWMNVERKYSGPSSRIGFRIVFLLTLRKIRKPDKDSFSDHISLMSQTFIFLDLQADLLPLKIRK